MNDNGNNLASYLVAVMGKMAHKPDFGQPVWLSGTIVLAANETNDIVIKASSSRDLQIRKITVSQDSTPADRLDPWQSDVVVRKFNFSSQLKADIMEHVLDGEPPIGDVFGRDSRIDAVDLITRDENVTFQFRNTSQHNSHRVTVTIEAAFWKPILSGLDPVK